MQSIDLALSNLFCSFLANPDSVKALSEVMNPCHTALDVAQDALDAVDNGKMSVSTARKVIDTILEDLEPKPVDNRADRVKLEKDVLDSVYWLYRQQKINYDQMWSLRASITDLTLMSCADLHQLKNRLVKYH